MTKNIVAYVHVYMGQGRTAGGETTLHDMLRYLVAHGWTADVVVSCPNPGQGEYWYEGIHVIPQTDKRTILHWVPKASVSISHLDNAERTFFVSKKFKTPSILLAHSDHPIIGGYLAHGPALAVFNTEWVKAAHGYQGNCLVVHPAVEGARYAAPKAPKDELRVTMVNMWSYKGSEIFWEAAKRLPDVKFRCVRGGYAPQDIREGYDNVEIVDNTEDMAGVYAGASMILMPSKYESFGRIAVEGASQGVPAIVSDTLGLREALGDTGVYIRADSPTEADQYVAAIKRYQNANVRNAAGRKALARFKTMEARSAEELEAFRINAEQIVELNRTMRGW